jgi:hypothetical protein
MRGLSAEQQQEGVMMLNALLDAYKAERCWVYAITRAVVPINANQQQYVIGLDTSGGVPDWYMERPEVIQRAGFLYSGQTNPVIEVAFEIYNEQQWDALSPKSLTSTIPYVLYYQPFVPNGIVNLWPIPVQGWQAALYLWTTLSYVSGPDDVLEMPPAYNDALSYGLAVRLSTLYPQFFNPATFVEVKNQAAAAKQRIRTVNQPALLMQAEFASMGVRGDQNYGSRYNPWSNSYNN